MVQSSLLKLAELVGRTTFLSFPVIRQFSLALEVKKEEKFEKKLEREKMFYVSLKIERFAISKRKIKIRAPSRIII